MPFSIFNPVEIPPSVLEAARKCAARLKEGFDVGIDKKKLEKILRSYHNNQQIGIPKHHESYKNFGKVLSGRRSGKCIIAIYTIMGSRIPHFAPGSTSTPTTVQVKVSLDYMSVSYMDRV